jgi:hypothetical protein
MSRAVVFVHGANVHSLCWERFAPRFQAAGWTTHTPDWPRLSGDPATLRDLVDDVAGLGIEEIVDHYAAFIEGLPEPPSLVGLGGVRRRAGPVRAAAHRRLPRRRRREGLDRAVDRRAGGLCGPAGPAGDLPGRRRGHGDDG